MAIEGSSEGLRPALKAFSRAVIIALVVLIAVALGSLQVLRVNGPVYHRIVLGKDLIADILPPPEYVLEAYLEATLALNAAGAVQTHADRLAVLKTQYDERQVYWTQSDLDASLKQQILETSNAPAQRFWTVVEADFLPALRRGDTAAAAAAYGQISAAYDEHRAAVDKLVIDANAANVSAERFAILCLALFVGLMLLVTAGLIAMVARRAAKIALDVVDPLSHMTQVMIRLASGDLQVAIPHADRTDEVGAMAKALEAFKAQGLESARLREEENLARTGRDNDRRVAEGQRASALQVMADRVERETRDAVATVAEAMQAVSTRAGDMARSAASVDASSNDVAGTANEAMARSKSVATTAKELDTAIRRITLQVNDARSAAAQVVGAAGEAETSIDSLSRAVDQISRVTDLIAEIARQTNMLALNASVEAARAGETGKGFAVVAGEVRSLAEQTAAATAEIRNLIGGVHDSANSTITAVQGISVQVKGVDIASLAIASAVEEQAQATMAIAKSIDETSTMAERMAHSVRLVSQEARAAEAISREVNALSISVTDEIDQLSSTLVRVVRTSTSEVERRRRPRYAVNIAAHLNVQGVRHQIKAVNLSVGGALVLGAKTSPGTRVTLNLSGVNSPIKAEVIGLDREMLHLKFDASPDQQTQLEALIARNGAPAVDDAVGDTEAA